MKCPESEFGLCDTTEPGDVCCRGTEVSRPQSETDSLAQTVRDDYWNEWDAAKLHEYIAELVGQFEEVKQRLAQAERELWSDRGVMLDLQARAEQAERENAALRKALSGLLEIAEAAMPDSYFDSDSRVRAARAALASSGPAA